MNLIELKEVVEDACMYMYDHADDDRDVLTRVMMCIAKQQALPPFLQIYLITHPQRNDTEKELFRMIEDIH